MNTHRQNASPETVAAVVALGKASSEFRRLSAGLDSRERAMVERVARTPAAPAALIELVGEASSALAARERALSSVWPISSASRPDGNAHTLAQVERAMRVLDDPRMAKAGAILALDPDATVDLRAEIRHLVDLRARLDSAGCDRSENGSGGVRLAADVWETFHSLGTESDEAAERRLAELTQAQSSLEAVSAVALDILSSGQLPAATVSQARNLARAIAAMPVPQTRALASASALREADEALASAVEAARAVASTAARIDSHVGSAWRSEPAAKLAQAAAILSDASDRRSEGARKYALSLGVAAPSEQAARQLRMMARTLGSMEPSAIDGDVAEALAPLPLAGVESLEAARGYVSRALAWREVLDASEMASHAIGKLMRSGRCPPPEVAGFVADTLAPFASTSGKVPLVELVDGTRRDLHALREAISRAKALGPELMAGGKAARRTLREHRAAEARIRSDAAFDEAIGIDGLVEGVEWLASAEEILPSSLDPTDPVAVSSMRASLEEARSQAVAAARKLTAIGKIVGADGTGWDLPHVAMLTRIHGAALASGALEMARERVSRVNGYQIVATLEEDSVPGERWGEYLEVRPDAPAPAREAIEEAPPPKASRPSFDFADGKSWKRKPLGKGTA